MPELPEVEVLVRHLAPLLKGKIVRAVEVRRVAVLSPTPVARFRRAVAGARFTNLSRRGKYLLFELQPPNSRKSFCLLGHLGMTGRMYVARADDPLPKHTAVVLSLGRRRLIYEDTRYFGRLTLDTRALSKLGPEPLAANFTANYFATALKRSSQPIKVKLLDQTLVAGVGNIYASEALFRARISPRLPARKLTREQVARLRQSIRRVLRVAIDCGSTLPLNFSTAASHDGLFYFGRAVNAPDFYAERLRVYDRADRPCLNCRTPIQRIVQAARSTFFCPQCQPGPRNPKTHPNCT
jgi:formamidopyrimidine-DNA glycosylase